MTAPRPEVLRSVRLRLLPWSPTLREPSWDAPDVSTLIPDDLDDAFAWVGLAVVLLLGVPVVLALLLFSAELALVLALVPLAMAGQLLGLLPWVLVLRTAGGERRYVEVKGTRAMLARREALRGLRGSAVTAG